MLRHLSKRITLMILVAALLIAPAAIAGDSRGGGNQGNGNQYFDPDTVTTVTGELTRLYADWEPLGHGNHTGDGTHFELRTGDGTTYDLILGPAYYLEDSGISLSVGDTVTVTGSVVDSYYAEFSDNQYLIATRITADGVTLDLRDEDGYPLWSGGNGGGQGRGGLGPNGERYFDPDTVTTLSGTLIESLNFWSCYGYGNYTGSGMHYLFRSDAGDVYYAMLGPWWFLEDNGVELEVGLRVTITGSVVAPYYEGYDDHSYLIASEITVGGVTVQLRDEDGYPLWSGTGRHYYSPSYDAGTSGALAGTVLRVRTRTHGADLDAGLELLVRSGGRRYTVFLGPQYYCENLDMSLARGDQIMIRGSIQKRQVVANYVVCDGERYRFRDRRGNSLWVGGAQ